MNCCESHFLALLHIASFLVIEWLIIMLCKAVNLPYNNATHTSIQAFSSETISGKTKEKQVFSNFSPVTQYQVGQ